MILISHRGNIKGKQPSFENSPDYIMEAVEAGYDVEIDVWWKDDSFWLGHDYPEYKTNVDFLFKGSFWIHCKNIEALCRLQPWGLNTFWHDTDDYTLTNRGVIWAYPNKPVPKGYETIAVLPEIYNTDVTNFDGICSDYIESYDNDKTGTI